MILGNLVSLFMVLSSCLRCESFVPGLGAFDLNKTKGPAPTDPDVYRNVSQLITSKGYPVEEHFVVTPDYYILNIQRIPHGRKKQESAKRKPVVLLQHGLLADSACWVTNFPHNSLGFILADHGFDVWLGNSRGNRYASRNECLLPSFPKFWMWSFDNMAKYDVPSTIDYILNTTGQARLFYIGHSQGTLIAFASFSTQPEIAKKVKLFIALAPIADIGHIKSRLLMDLADITATVESIGPVIDVPFLTGNYWRELIREGLCNGFVESRLCYKIFQFLVGENDKNMNYSRIPVYLSNFPSGTSFRNMVHYAQMVVSGKCQMFDYGLIENFFRYGQSKPPQYPIQDMKTRTVLFSGTHDALSDPKDVTLLTDEVKHLVFNETIYNWNHVDFIWGVDAPIVLYTQITYLLRKHL